MRFRLGAVALVFFLSGCGGADLPVTKATSAPPSPVEQQPRARLAGLVATAKDRQYVGIYTLAPKTGAARTVTVTLATDGNWRIDLPGGALGGAANISLVNVKGEVYQCGVAPSTGTAPASPPPPGCAKLASPVPTKYDSRVQHLFSDWMDVLTSRAAAINVAVAPALTGAKGTCFSVESTSASLAAPLDPGVYCYADDGTLTGARFGLGTLTLTGVPGAPPATVPLPGPVTSTPLALAAPPTPTPSPTRH